MGDWGDRGRLGELGRLAAKSGAIVLVRGHRKQRGDGNTEP